MEHLEALAIGLLLFLGLLGWGALLEDRTQPDRGVFATAAIGLVAWIFLGGLLNAAHLATLPSLSVVWVLGLAGWARRYWSPLVRALEDPRARAALVAPRRLTHLPALVVLAALALGVPTEVFNPVDDFQNYLVVPQRMLQTGTVGGNPIGDVGVDSLGAQSFLHGFVLMLFPIRFLTVVDPLLGMLLCVGLTAEITERRRCPRALCSLATLLLVFVNVQQINLSATYSAACLALLGVVLASRLLGPGPRPYREAVVLGAALGALVSLKLTFGPFAACFGLVLVTWLCATRRRALALGVGAGSLIMLVPWLTAVLHGVDLGHLHLGAKGFAGGGRLSQWLTDPTLFWGGRLRDYRLLVLMLVVAAAAAGRRLPRDCALPLIAATAAVAVGLVLWTWLAGVVLALRYQAPLLAALTPVATAALVPAARTLQGRIGPSVIVAGLLFTLALAAFYNETGVRIARGRELAYVYAYPQRADLAAVARAALDPEVGRYLRALQDDVPAGAPMLVLIGAPFHLDFARNPLLTFHGTGLAAPWAEPPESAAAVPAWLGRLGVRYVLWQTRGVGVKGAELLEVEQRSGIRAVSYPARVTLAIRRAMVALARTRPPLRREGPFYLFDLDGTDSRSSSRGEASPRAPTRSAVLPRAAR